MGKCGASAVVLTLALSGLASGADKVTAAGARAAIRARATVVMGTVWTATSEPVRDARLRLRNVLSGKIEATALADDAGKFTFQNIEGGTYTVELVTETGKVIAVGHMFTIAPGETVATFVRLGTKVPWFTGFFSNAASAAATTAAAQGVTAIAPVAPPASRGK